jgi:hypothetical protein
MDQTMRKRRGLPFDLIERGKVSPGQKPFSDHH